MSDPRRVQEEGEACLGLLSTPKKSMIHADAASASRGRMAAADPPGFPTVPVYPCLKIRSEELGNTPKHSEEH